MTADIVAPVVAEAVSIVPAGIRVLSSARWPEHPQDVLTPLAGFIGSSFNPLVAEVAERCLNRCHGEHPVREQARAIRTAVLLASSGWDQGTASLLSQAVQSGGRVQPLLFFQSNPNAVLGHVAARWGLGGPVVCVGAAPVDANQDSDQGCGHGRDQDRDQDKEMNAVLAEALAEAALVIGDGDADEALVIVAEQGGATRQRDGAVAFLVARDTADMTARTTRKGRIR